MDTTEQEILDAFAEFTAEPSASAADTEAAKVAADAEAAKTAADAEAAKVVADAAKTTADTEAAKTAADAEAAKAADAEKTAADAEAAKAVADASAATKVVETAPAAPVDSALSAGNAAELAAVRAELEELKGRIKTEPVVATPVYSKDEETVLAKYQEDWPDVAKGEALLRRAEYRELVGYIFQQVEQRYAPTLEYMNNRSGHDQYSDIVSLVPDYDVVRDKAIAWVDTQPEWLRASLKRVTEEGTAAEVAGLITMYKKETGYVATAAPAAPAAPAAKPAAPALPAAAKKAAESLAAVKSSRSDQTLSADDGDVTAMFNQYAEAEDKKSVRK